MVASLAMLAIVRHRYKNFSLVYMELEINAGRDQLAGLWLLDG